jgi:hypothetical protein
MNEWIEQIFDAKQARNGGIVRRSRKSVAMNASEAELISAVQRRGFHIVRTGKQYVIFCDGGDVRLIR